MWPSLPARWTRPGWAGPGGSAPPVHVGDARVWAMTGQTPLRPYRPVEIRPLRPADHHGALALNNANLPALSALDAAELARLVGMSVASLAADVDGRFAGFCIVLPPG